MSLTLQVGLLSALEGDVEGADWFRADIEKVNQLLASHGLPVHEEPDTCEIWGADMFGYAGLHYLRRIACHLDARDELPEPGGEDGSSDPICTAYWNDWHRPQKTLLRRLFGSKTNFARGFDHLVLHSDAEGFYLPLDLESVLVGPEELSITGEIVGSVPQLLAECERLAAELEIPSHVDTEAEVLWKAASTQDQGASETWQRYGVESFTCVALMEGCHHSLKTGAALVFG